MEKTFIVHFFIGAPCAASHEVHEYSETELREDIFGTEQQYPGPDGLLRNLADRIAGMRISETFTFEIEDDRVVIHRMK